MKTNAMRLLDAAKIGYEIKEYDLKDREFSGEAVSELLGMDPKSCFKTLALKNGHDLFVCVISVNDELDLKKAAKQMPVKSLEMVHVKDLLKETGYIRGGVTPIGIKKTKKIVFDDEILSHDKIGISGGQKGITLLVRPEEIVWFLNAEVADIIE